DRADPVRLARPRRAPPWPSRYKPTSGIRPRTLRRRTGRDAGRCHRNLPSERRVSRSGSRPGAPNEAVRAEPAGIGTGRSRDPLGLEIRLLGALLGQVIAEQEGRELLDLVE